jgi:hypothetical protein
MTEIKMLTIGDPEQVRRFAAVIASQHGITYVTHRQKGKPKSIDIMLDVADPKDQELLEALL